LLRRPAEERTARHAHEMHERVRAVELIRTGDFEGARRRALERSVRRGELERLRPGVLITAGAAAHLRPDEKHVLAVRAALPRIRSSVAISHLSAALVHGWPIICAPPPRIHLTDPASDRTVVTSWFVRHGGAGQTQSTVRDFDGAHVSGFVRTVVDIAAVGELETAVAVVDHVLHHALVSADALALAASDIGKGSAKARRALELGSALSESPAESLCRVRFVQLRTPQPVQQHVFVRPGERPARVDFWFPDQGVVVEVDGRSKYAESGDVADAHWREKRREDFIRSFPEVRTVVRLSWSDLMDPERVRAALRRAGVPCR
jgi:hypothetical protein